MPCAYCAPTHTGLLIESLCNRCIRFYRERLRWRRSVDVASHDGRFLEDVGGNTFKFKAGLNSEVELTKIVEREGSCIGYKSKEDLIYGLRTLVNNVVLIRDDERPNDAFYPRIEMWKTSSFQEIRYACPTSPVKVPRGSTGPQRIYYSILESLLT